MLDEAERIYPGTATDVADGNEVTNELVDDETRILNNNPRNYK